MMGSDEKKIYFWAAFMVPIVLFLCFAALSSEMTHGLYGVQNMPAGSDFSIFYGAGKNILENKVNNIYDLDRFYDSLKEILGTDLDYHRYFSYPPVILLFLPLLAMFPYTVSLGIWLFAGVVALASALRLLRSWAFAFLIVLSSPAILMNAISGQNGPFIAALLGGGLTLLSKSPILAGALLGGLVIKPHIALLVPIALVASRSWAALFSAAAMALSLCFASLLIFGLSAWQGYFGALSYARDLVLTKLSFLRHSVSIFSSLRSFGVAEDVVYTIQISIFVIMVMLIFIIWSKGKINGYKKSFLVLACFFSTPYLFHYDLAVLCFIPFWIFDDVKYRNRNIFVGFFILSSMVPVMSLVIFNNFDVVVGILLVIPLLVYLLYLNFLKFDMASTKAILN